MAVPGPKYFQAVSLVKSYIQLPSVAQATDWVFELDCRPAELPLRSCASDLARTAALDAIQAAQKGEEEGEKHVIIWRRSTGDLQTGCDHKVKVLCVPILFP